MSDDPTQTTVAPEPAQTPAEPQSAPIIAPEPTQVPAEPLPASTVDSTATNIPPEAQNGPQSPTTPVSAEMPVSTPLPQNPPSASISAPVEPPPAPASAAQPVVVIQQTNPRSFLAKALEKIQFRKRAKLEKVVKLAIEKKSITNDQVEKLLHISDSTAQRYLTQLAKEGKLKRIGKDGSSLYEPMNGSNPTN